MVCELHEKFNVLWSFIKTHLRSKVIIFLSTCKQVKFMYEAFKKLRPGVPLRSLHGKMKQFKRMAVFYDFCEVGTFYSISLLTPVLIADLLWSCKRAWLALQLLMGLCYCCVGFLLLLLFIVSSIYPVLQTEFCC